MDRCIKVYMVSSELCAQFLSIRLLYQTMKLVNGKFKELRPDAVSQPTPLPQPRQTAVELQSTVNTLLINSVSKSTKKAYDTGLKTFIQFLLLQGLAFDCSKFRDCNSPRFSIRKIFHLNPELGQNCSEITNMFKTTKHP